MVSVWGGSLSVWASMCAVQSLVTPERHLLGESFGVNPVEFDVLVPFMKVWRYNSIN